MELRKEPVVVFQALVVPALIAVSLVLNLSTEVQGYVDAALLAVGGVIAAFGVSVRAALPLLAGLVKAVIALLLALGVDVPSNWQAAIMTLIAVTVAFFTQSQVTAKSDYALAS
jgi:hypothetical protein